MRWRSSWPRKIQDSVHTTRNTSPVIASTSLVFSLMGSHQTLFLAYGATDGRGSARLSCGAKGLNYRPLFCDVASGRTAILLQLVMQCLQTDAQDLGRAGLVVTCRLQGFQDEHALGFVHCASDLYMNAAVAVVGASCIRTHEALPEGRRQMPCLHVSLTAENDRSFDGVSQFAHVTRPVVAHQAAQHLSVDSLDLPPVLGVHVVQQRFDNC